MMEDRYDVVKVTEWRKGAVYKTKIVKSIWLVSMLRTQEEKNAIARDHGGDMLAATKDYRIGGKNA